MRYRQAMDSAFDVLTFLLYAAALGLCAGALLGALALVLASPAHASGGGGGTLFLLGPSGEAASPAPLVSMDTAYRADGPIQRVRIVETYRNPLPGRHEGLFAIRLPENATLERVAISVRAASDEDDDGRDEEGDPDPVAAPALIAGDEPGVVTRSIAAIESGDTVLVEVEYQQVVRYDRGRNAPRLLTLMCVRPVGLGRRRRVLPTAKREAVPLGVEGAWMSTTHESPGAPWLWVVPVVALYALVAFFN